MTGPADTTGNGRLDQSLALHATTPGGAVTQPEARPERLASRFRKSQAFTAPNGTTTGTGTEWIRLDPQARAWTCLAHPSRDPSTETSPRLRATVRQSLATGRVDKHRHQNREPATFLSRSIEPRPGQDRRCRDHRTQLGPSTAVHPPKGAATMKTVEARHRTWADPTSANGAQDHPRHCKDTVDKPSLRFRYSLPPNPRFHGTGRLLGNPRTLLANEACYWAIAETF